MVLAQKEIGVQARIPVMKLHAPKMSIEGRGHHEVEAKQEKDRFLDQSGIEVQTNMLRQKVP